MRDPLQPAQLGALDSQQDAQGVHDRDLPIERYEDGLYRRLDALEALAVSLGLMVDHVVSLPPGDRNRARHE